MTCDAIYCRCEERAHERDRLRRRAGSRVFVCLPCGWQAVQVSLEPPKSNSPPNRIPA
jgi:hypothetical protein